MTGRHQENMIGRRTRSLASSRTRPAAGPATARNSSTTPGGGVVPKRQSRSSCPTPTSQRNRKNPDSATYSPTTSNGKENHAPRGVGAVSAGAAIACGVALSGRKTAGRSVGPATRGTSGSSTAARTSPPPPPTGPASSAAGSTSSVGGAPSQPSDQRAVPGRRDSHGTSRQPSNVSSIRRMRRAGSRHSRTARAPRARTTKLPSAAWASQYQTGVCQAMSFALRPLRLLSPARPGDQLLQVFQVLGAGVGRLQQAQHELVHCPVEDLVKEAGRHLLAAVCGRVDEGPALLAVRHQSLLLHDAEDGLDGVEVPLAAGAHALMHLADAGRAQLPQHLEDLQLAFARNCVAQVTLPGRRPPIPKLIG